MSEKEEKGIIKSSSKEDRKKVSKSKKMFCILFLSFMIILFNNIFLLLATFAPLTSWEHSYGTFSFVFSPMSSFYIPTFSSLT